MRDERRRPDGAARPVARRVPPPEAMDLPRRPDGGGAARPAGVARGAPRGAGVEAERPGRAVPTRARSPREGGGGESGGGGGGPRPPRAPRRRPARGGHRGAAAAPG